MSESQSPAAVSPSSPNAEGQSGKWSMASFALRVLWIAIKALIVFLLLVGGANPAVIYQRF